MIINHNKQDCGKNSKNEYKFIVRVRYLTVQISNYFWSSSFAKMCAKMLSLLIICAIIHQSQSAIGDILFEQVKLVKTPISANHFNISKIKLTQSNRFNYFLDMNFEIIQELDGYTLVNVNIFKKRTKSQTNAMLVHNVKDVSFPQAIYYLHNNILRPDIGAFEGHSNLPTFHYVLPYELKEVLCEIIYNVHL